jgi:hypothetical protein
VHKRISSAVKRVEFVNDRMSYIILSDCWNLIIVLNVHVQQKIKLINVKDSFDEGFEPVFDKFPNDHMVILL